MKDKKPVEEPPNQPEEPPVKEPEEKPPVKEPPKKEPPHEEVQASRPLKAAGTAAPLL